MFSFYSDTFPKSQIGQKPSHVFAGDGQRVVAGDSGADAKRGDAGVFAAVDVAEERKTNRFGGKMHRRIRFALRK